MKAERFEEAVKARAAIRVQAKIGTFKRAVLQAVAGLTGLESTENYKLGQRGDFYGWNLPEVAVKCLSIAASPAPSKGWPKQLWDAEEKKVREELLSTLDEMQKALMAEYPQDGPMPEDEEVKP